MIKLICFDFDGVFTDAKNYINDKGDLYKSVNSKDLYGLKIAKENGLMTGIITASNAKCINNFDVLMSRLDMLSQGRYDKFNVLNEWRLKYELDWQEIAYIGDDLPDLEVLMTVGISGSPSDAIKECKQIAKYICKNIGGTGAVREFIEYVVQNNNNNTNKKIDNSPVIISHVQTPLMEIVRKEYNEFKILDCTLRDGGYINNWNFNNQQARELYLTLLKSGIDYMEVGFHDNLKIYDNKFVSVFRRLNDDIIRNMFEDIYDDRTKICVMVNEGSFDISTFKSAKDSIISLVRIAFHKDGMESALEKARQFKELGYAVAVNAMGSTFYTDEELEELCKLSMKANVDYIYIADSYGSLDTNQLLRLITNLRNTLASLDNYSIKIGFHAHNNTQRALMNGITCIKHDVHIIDSTMFGMGRGAGNLPTEVLLSELNKNYDNNKFTDDSIKYAVKFIHNYLLDLNQKNYNNSWSYSIPYFISGHFEIHPNFVWKLLEYKIDDIEYIFNICKKIKHSCRGNKFCQNLLNDMLN